ncbi:MAG: exodeoxyribonuclease VII small subunit [Clostridia bacterium]
MEKTKTFEESLDELESVATKLENGKLSLDEAISEFEKGMKLSKECSEKLDKAEKKINILIKDELGIVSEEKFEEN